MAAHTAHRAKVFLEPRPLEHYVGALEAAGLLVEDVSERTVKASVHEWYEFLTAYHDAVLGWVGGTERTDGAAPAPAAVRDRLGLMRHAMETLFDGRPDFNACWTSIVCVR